MPQKPISLGHGKGSIFKRCECADQTRCKHEWHIRYRIDGRPREEGHDQGWTRRQAEGRLKEVNRAKFAEAPVERAAIRSVPSFERFTGDYLRGRIDLGKNTQRNYRSILENHVYPELGRLPINRIARNPHVLNQFKHLVDTGFTYGRLKVTRDLLHMVFEEARLEKVITDNPVTRIPLPPEPLGEFYLPTAQEIHALAEAMPPHLSLGVYLGAGCGLRLGEILAANASCLREGNTYRLNHQWTKHSEFGPLKHRLQGEYRDTPISDELVSCMEEHQKRYGLTPDGYYLRGMRREFLKLRTPRSGEHLRDVPVSHAAWATAFSTARRIAQIPPEVDTKSLRHFFASTAVRNGIPLSDVADYMGHKDMQVTHKTYKHLLPESLTSMSRVVSKALFR
ncbi:tyrosine-type recombinase/integrase [Nocardiopsis dassonvillei]